MNRNRAILSSVKGSTFLMTMICMFLMSLTGGYTYKMSVHNTFFTNELRKSLQAQAIAEAGLATALSSIRTSWSNINGTLPSGSFAGGTYATTRVTSGGRYLVKSTGTYKGHSRIASAELTAPSGGALNYVFAGGGNGSHIVDSGTGQSPGSISGDIYGSGNFTLDGPSSGGSLTVSGTLYASQTAQLGTNTSVSGGAVSNYSSTVTFPTVDFTYYRAIAQTNGQYFNSKTYASGTIPANPAGGVIYINGNLTIRGTQSTTACIIATGNITIEKTGSTYPRVTINQYSNYPALMTQNGEITFTSTGNGGAYLTTTGLVYAGNNFHIDSGNHDTFTFTGSVLSRGEIQFNLQSQNTLTATYVAQSPPGLSNTGSNSATIESYNS